MTRRPLLVILNPRNIEACMDAFAELHIDKAYVRGYTEAEIAADAWDRVMAMKWADPISIVSDDTIVTQRAVSTVLALHSMYPRWCVTGWCPLAEGHDLCNLSRNKLPEGPPNEGSYDFLTCDEARADRGGQLISSSFAGMALTTMSRELWERFPFDVYGGQNGWGFASDYHLSYRLQQAGVSIVSHRDAEIRHVKKTWNEPDPTPGRELLVGKITRQVLHTAPFPGIDVPLQRKYAETAA